MPHLLPFASFLLAVSTLLPAQEKVALPHATGTLSPPPEWTVLRGDAIASAARPTDPTDEPAQTILLEMLRHLQQEARTAEHVVLHQPGKEPGQLRSVNAYSADVAATSAALQSDRAIDEMRRAQADAFARPNTKVVYTGGTKWEAYAVGGVTIGFELEVGEHVFVNQVHVVPAGDRLQYFEVQYDRRDEQAPLAIAHVLSTFDGAREKDTSMPMAMILGGIGGAVAGVLAGKLRNRRRAAAAAQRSGSAD